MSDGINDLATLRPAAGRPRTDRVAGGVTAFGPSLVDLSAKLASADFRSWCNALGVGPGGWLALPDWARVNALIRLLARAPIALGREFYAITSSDAMVLSAGSSTLGTLSAMPERVRRRSTYVSTLATRNSALDPFSTYFATAVRELRLSHLHRVVPGHNPVSFVIYESATPDQVLATYAGVATESVPMLDHVTRPELVLLDTCELLAGACSVDLHDLIVAGQVPVGLSLGNAGILTGEVRNRLRGYLEDGRLEMVFGNSAEYRMLYPELPPAMASLAGFREHPVCRDVRFCLLTDGERGMAAHGYMEFARVPANQLPPAEIVNTSGAGDTSAEVFAAGVLDEVELPTLLTRCAALASQVLRLPGSRIVG
ncbi:MAG: hypothetical protein GEV28_08680 [Actinophytocola sp.]|uniref:PfkB family carbohydrate kinase n=1 Tax=Actinophytocola sp. TaxID=1872138 RepID=UPI001325FEAD|nr:PfkB family carbohydrate kinase [Actinophytocola sp.]MPZ80453.1 hypothetical protein [Actinophytocola sp.]